MIKIQKPSTFKSRIALLLSMAIIASIGLIDAMYLTVTHYTNTLVPCNFTQSCETVLTSKYSEIFGFPVAGLGIIFYIVVLAGSVFFIQHRAFHWWLLVWSTTGLLSTFYLLYIQAYVLNAFCQYCLLSAITSTLIFILAGVLYFINNMQSERQ